MWIYRAAPQTNLEMEVRGRHATGRARIRHHFAAADLLPGYNVEVREMRVPGAHSVPMVDDYELAVGRCKLRGVDDSVGGSPHGCPERGLNIDTGMEATLARERVHTLAEPALDDAVHRPHAGHDILQPGPRIGMVETREVRRFEEVVLLDRFPVGGHQHAFIGDIGGARSEERRVGKECRSR